MVPPSCDIQPSASAARDGCTGLVTNNSRAAAALADHPFMSSIPLELLDKLATSAQLQTFPAGTRIFAEGDVADRFLLIKQGLVRLDMASTARAEAGAVGAVAVETLGADAALGWSWLFPPYRWQLSATAVQRTRALVCDAAALRVAMAADPELGYELMRRFAGVVLDRLQATRRRLAGDAAVAQGATCGPWAGKPSAKSR